MDVFGLVGKNDKGRRPGSYLGGKVEFHPAAVRQRGMMGFNGIGKHMHKFRRGNASAILRHYVINGFYDLAGTLAGFGGNEDNRGVRHVFKTVPDFFRIGFEGGVVLIEKIPLVNDKDTPLASFMDITG